MEAYQIMISATGELEHEICGGYCENTLLCVVNILL